VALKIMSSILSETTDIEENVPTRMTRRQLMLMIIGFVVLLIIALLMRLHTLGVLFDRDSYDEGVYWQTLRAVSAGFPLYNPTFYSQPPMFILSALPTYLLFGQTIWAARLGITLVSLFGLLGIFLLGYTLRGRLGAFAALILLVLNPLYLSASQTLQAEGPEIAFSALAVAFAYLWWRRPSGWRGNLYGALCTLTLILSLFSKLFAVATIVPIGLLALAHIWRIMHQPVGNRWQAAFSLLLALVVLILTTIIIMLPYYHVLPSFWSGVVAFHDAAETVSTRAGNLKQIELYLFTLPDIAAPLGLAACFGAIVALIRKDWLVIPLIAWALVSSFLLLDQDPLFQHHFVILAPPLVALAIMGLGKLSLTKEQLTRRPMLITEISLLLILIALVVGAWAIRENYHTVQTQEASPATQGSIQVSKEIQQVVKPGNFVVTDGQFVTALAGRSTPPQLVDTSSVRIETNYVTNQQLIQLASQTRVQAVLFYTGRLTNPDLTEFRNWVKLHFHEIHTYGNGSSLWIKVQ
jgi:4-amino-4-deoxy-L-arabinose transferase-like glycosyltransferase